MDLRYATDRAETHANEVSSNKNVRPMRRARVPLLSVALAMASGCFSYHRSEYYAPLGSGEIERDGFSVPRLMKVRLSTTSYISLGATLPPQSKFTAFISLDGEETLRFGGTKITISCGSEAPHEVELSEIVAGVQRSGVGAQKAVPVSTPLRGKGSSKALLDTNEEWQGRYWIEAPLPKCDGQELSVTTPEIWFGVQSLGSVTVVFDRKSGRHLNVVEVM